MEILKIQKAEKNDFSVLYDLMKDRSEWLEKKNIRQWIYPLSKENFERYTKNKDVYKIIKKQEIVGMFIVTNKMPEYYPEDIKDRKNTLYLSKLLTKLSEKGSGLGSKALESIELYARENNIKFLRLDCVPNPDFLTNFYKKNGYNLIFQAQKTSRFDKFTSSVYKSKTLNYLEKKL